MTENVPMKRHKLVICTSPPEEVVASNEDLLLEILLCVPAKSLIRFKCVSKRWLSLMSDPNFGANHARRNSRSLMSGIYFYLDRCLFTEKVKSISLHNGNRSLPTFDLHFPSLRVIHACNGLMLCAYGCSRCYIVCNLTTNKYKALPDPPDCGNGASQNDTLLGGCLVFDPAKSHHYKVLSIRYICRQSLYQIDIYSSENKSWKRVDLTTTEREPMRYRVSWNGAVHWMSKTKLHIRFDIDDEKLTLTPLPPLPKVLDESEILYYGECCGHLFLIQTRSSKPMCFPILEMKSDPFHWIVKYRISLRPLAAVHPSIRSNFQVLSIVKETNDDEFALVLAIPGKIISYNLKGKTFKELGNIYDYIGPCDTLTLAYHFFEGLSPV